MKKITVLAILLILMGCSNDNASQAPASQVDDNISPQTEEMYHFLLGEIALDRDEPSVALEEYNALNESAPEALTAARATSIAIEQNDFEAAARSAKIWADATPNDIQTQAIAASIMLKTDNIDGALPFLTRMITQDDKKTFENLLILRSTLEDESHAKAYIELMQTYGMTHKDYRALFMGAATAQEIKDISTATTLSNEIANIDPNWMRGAVLRVQLQYESGNIDEALKSVATLIQNNPKEGMYRYLQAKMMLEKGDLESGVKALNDLKQDPKYRNEALMDLARISVQKKDFATANEYLNQLLTYDPNSDEAKYFSGYVSQQLGQPQIALQRFGGIKPGFYYVNANIQSALILGLSGHVDQGLSLLEGMMQKYPKDRARIELVKTQLLLDANRVEEAYASLNSILTGNGEDIELRYIRGLVAMELGHNDQAEVDLRFVATTVPNHLEALNDLTSLLIEQKNYDEAKFYVEKALALAPKNPKALDNMGWLLHEQGQTAASLEYLEKAHSVSPDDVIAAHFGQALWETGKHQDALKVWNAALKKHPNDPILIKVMGEHVVTPASN